MSAIKNVEKSLITQEDIAYGEGAVAQTRAGTPYNLNQVRIIQPVNSIAELNALDVTKFVKAVLFNVDKASFYSYYSGAWHAEMPPESNTALTLQNSWVNDAAYQVATAYKKLEPLVYLAGVVKNGTATAGTIIANLPAGYRPSALRRISTANAAGVVILSVAVNGDLKIEVGTNAIIALDGLHFRI